MAEGGGTRCPVAPEVADRPLAEAFPRLRGPLDTPRLAAARRRARTYADTHVRPIVMDLDRRAALDPSTFDWDLVRAGCGFGLLTYVIPPVAGGDGGLTAEACVILEELSAACPGVANIFGAHALGIAPLLVSGVGHWGGVLRQIAEAERAGRPMLMACAVTEPEAGTDVEDPDLLAKARIGTHARRVDGGYLLSGTKRFISNGSVATWITVCMPTDPTQPVDTWTCFLVARETPGLTVGRIERKMGQRACHAAELHFDDVFVPDAQLVGRPGDGMPGTLLTLALSRPVVGAIATGIARGAYERVLAWAQEQPGLLGHQEAQLVLARMEQDIHVARQAYLDAATDVDATLGVVLRHPLVRSLRLVPPAVRRTQAFRRVTTSHGAVTASARLLHRITGERANTRSLALSSLAKALGADTAVAVTTAALDLAGLDATIRPELDKLWRDAKLTQIYEGTNQLNRVEVYRGLVRQETMATLPRIDRAVSGEVGS